jgi:hypothetical protein
MSSIEELLVRDIAAVTGGIVVTDSDLREARDAVNERIYGRRSRLRRGGVVAVAAAAVVLVAVAAAGVLALRDDKAASQLGGSGPDLGDPDTAYLSGQAPTLELIKGVWREDNGNSMVKFSADGTVLFDRHGTLFSHPATAGTYVIDRGLITVTITQDVQQSCIGRKFSMRASLPKVGTVRFISSQSEVSTCVPMTAARGALEQVLPSSPEMASLVFSTDPGWQPLSDKGILAGVWLTEGGGHLLEIDSGGSYYVADESGQPVDSGVWSFRNATLTLTSSARSASCRQGDKLVLGAMQHENTSTRAFRGTVGQNTCGANWTPAAWILIPNADSR